MLTSFLWSPLYFTSPKAKHTVTCKSLGIPAKKNYCEYLNSESKDDLISKRHAGKDYISLVFQARLLFVLEFQSNKNAKPIILLSKLLPFLIFRFFLQTVRCLMFVSRICRKLSKFIPQIVPIPLDAAKLSMIHPPPCLTVGKVFFSSQSLYIHTQS